MGITLYCGISEKKWNHHPVNPGPFACISPTYGKSERTRAKNRVTVPGSVAVIQDSGAFSDSWSKRLTFEDALQRQMEHAHEFGYASQITHRASYDLLIDEVWDGNNRHKRRWTEQAAEKAVETTIDAARYIVQHRHGLGLVLSAQGVTATQYLECVKGVLPYLDRERDILGLGGWCIIGKLPKQMTPTFIETINLVIPYAASKGVRKAHIWGVIYPDALGPLLWLCNEHKVALSTDSAGPANKPFFGEWGYGDWIDKNYRRPDVSVRGLDRARHVEQTRKWLAHFERTRYYRAPSARLKPKQQRQVAAGQMMF